jgi:DNA primase
MKVGRHSINVSNTDKVLFPDDGVTKGDLIDYYEAVGPQMVSYLKGRHCPSSGIPTASTSSRCSSRTHRSTSRSGSKPPR